MTSSEPRVGAEGRYRVGVDVGGTFIDHKSPRLSALYYATAIHPPLPPSIR